MDVQARKRALRMVSYGLYVLTTGASNGAAGPHAATVSWLSQASFEPPRIVVGLRRETDIWRGVQAAQSFVVNVLGSDQKNIAARFFRHIPSDGETLAGFRCHTGLVGAPILDDVPAYLECRVVQALEAGDHTLFLAEVVEAGVQHEGQALSLADTGWHYGG